MIFKSNVDSKKIGDQITTYLVARVIEKSISGNNLPGVDDLVGELENVMNAFFEGGDSAGLNLADASKITNLLKQEHILCILCVMVLKVHDDGKELAEDLIDRIVQKIMQGLKERLGDSFPSPVGEAFLRTALKRLLQKMIDLVVASEKIKTLRLIGFVTCPDITKHSDVEEYCLLPVVKEILEEYFSDLREKGLWEKADGKPPVCLVSDLLPTGSDSSSAA